MPRPVLPKIVTTPTPTSTTFPMSSITHPHPDSKHPNSTNYPPHPYPSIPPHIADMIESDSTSSPPSSSSSTYSQSGSGTYTGNPSATAGGFGGRLGVDVVVRQRPDLPIPPTPIVCPPTPVGEAGEVESESPGGTGEMDEPLEMEEPAEMAEPLEMDEPMEMDEPEEMAEPEDIEDESGTRNRHSGSGEDEIEGMTSTYAEVCKITSPPKPKTTSRPTPHRKPTRSLPSHPTEEPTDPPISHENSPGPHAQSPASTLSSMPIPITSPSATEVFQEEHQHTHNSPSRYHPDLPMDGKDADPPPPEEGQGGKSGRERERGRRRPQPKRTGTVHDFDVDTGAAREEGVKEKEESGEKVETAKKQEEAREGEGEGEREGEEDEQTFAYDSPEEEEGINSDDDIDAEDDIKALANSEIMIDPRARWKAKREAEQKDKDKDVEGGQGGGVGDGTGSGGWLKGDITGPRRGSSGMTEMPQLEENKGGRRQSERQDTLLASDPASYTSKDGLEKKGSGNVGDGKDGSGSGSGSDSGNEAGREEEDGKREIDWDRVKKKRSSDVREVSMSSGSRERRHKAREDAQHHFKQNLHQHHHSRQAASRSRSRSVSPTDSQRSNLSNLGPKREARQDKVRREDQLKAGGPIAGTHIETSPSGMFESGEEDELDKGGMDGQVAGDGDDDVQMVMSPTSAGGESPMQSLFAASPAWGDEKANAAEPTSRYPRGRDRRRSRPSRPEGIIKSQPLIPRIGPAEGGMGENASPTTESPTEAEGVPIPEADDSPHLFPARTFGDMPAPIWDELTTSPSAGLSSFANVSGSKAGYFGLDKQQMQKMADKLDRDMIAREQGGDGRLDTVQVEMTEGDRLAQENKEQQRKDEEQSPQKESKPNEEHEEKRAGKEGRGSAASLWKSAGKQIMGTEPDKAIPPPSPERRVTSPSKANLGRRVETAPSELEKRRHDHAASSSRPASPRLSPAAGGSADFPGKLRLGSSDSLTIDHRGHPHAGHFHRRSSSTHRVLETLDAKHHSNAKGQKMVNQYVLGPLIGRGAYGNVEKGRDVGTGQEYAIKEFSKSRLRRQQQLSSKARQRKQRNSLVPPGEPPRSDSHSDDGKEGDPLGLIRREIAVMKKLDHPNLVLLYEAIDVPTSDSVYLVLEYVPGGSLMDIHVGGEPTPPLDPEVARSYTRQLVLGLEYLHSANITHRDIKPDNVLLSADKSTVKLCDFGVSEMFNAGDDTMKENGGSPAFMSPEAAISSERVVHGRPVDIWALGVTLYCMLRGRLPFEADNPLELFEAIKDLPAPIPHEWDVNVKDLLAKMLTKDPNDRIQMDELREHPWITEDGENPMPSTDSNLHEIGQQVDEPSEEEVGRAITTFRGVFTVIRAIQKWKRLGRHARTFSSGSSTSAASTPNVLSPNTENPPKLSARSRERVGHGRLGDDSDQSGRQRLTDDGEAVSSPEEMEERQRNGYFG